LRSCLRTGVAFLSFQPHQSETIVQPAIRWFRECIFVPHSSLRKTRAAAQAAPKTDATIDGDWIFCNLLFRSSNGVAEMKGIAAQFGWFGTGLFCLVTVGWVLASPQRKPLLEGLPIDWTHQHVIFSQPATAEQARLLANEPRFWQREYRRQALRCVSDSMAAPEEVSSLGLAFDGGQCGKSP
jgi:hypothetical protein